MRAGSLLAACAFLGGLVLGGCGSSGAAARFAAVDGWQGPAGRVEQKATAEPLDIAFTVPTVGYQLTLDEVVAGADVATVNLTLLAPAVDAAVAQVVSDVSVKLDGRLFGAAARVVIAVKQRQQGAHYFVDPPYVPALASAK